jgi:hypothetical protein
MYSALGDAALPAPGFPIRRSTGQRLFSASPWLIAAVHVLLRLLVPRHPPCALTILTVSCSRTQKTSTSSASYPLRPPDVIGEREKAPLIRGCAVRRNPFRHGGAWPNAVFKVHGGEPHGGIPPASLRTEQRHRGAQGAAGQARSTYREILPRKEVIQPQLPLRLPCYDFTPITSPTFDGSLP